MKISSTQNETGKSSRESAALTPLKTRLLLSDLVLLDQRSIAVFRKCWNKLYRRYGDSELLKKRDELRYFWHQVAPSRRFTRMEDLFQPTEHTEHIDNDYD